MASRLDDETAGFLLRAISRGQTINAVVGDPDRFAAAAGIVLTDAQRSAIAHLRSRTVTNRFTSLSPDAVMFLRAVIKDGRHIGDWKDDPAEVARHLGLKIAPDALDEVRRMDLSDVLPVAGPRSISASAAATVLAVAVSVVAPPPGLEREELAVFDFSKIEKL